MFSKRYTTKRHKWGIVRTDVPRITFDRPNYIRRCDQKHPLVLAIIDHFSCVGVPRICFDMPKFTRAYA